MTFGNADIEGAFRHLVHHDVHGAACRHGGCHTHNLGILTGQLQQRLAKDVLETRRYVGGVLDYTLSRLGIKPAWGVPDGDILLGRGVAVAFLGVQVQQFGTAHAFQLAQDAYQFLDVVTVEGTEVADVHAFEDVLLVRNGRLDSIRQADESTTAVVLKESDAVQPSRHLEAQGIVGLVGTQRQQVLLHAAHGTVDGHVVVVEDDEDVAVTGRHVVQTFIRQTARHGSVADDGHHVALVLG